MPFPIVLLFVFALLHQTPQTAPPKDALALLTEVSQRYADAKSYHIEVVEERTYNNELSRSWQKTLLTAIVMPGGRYRYEGQSDEGTAIYISDGIHHWDYLPDQEVFTERIAAGDDSSKKPVHLPDEFAASNAKAVVSVLAHRADVLKSTAFLPDETISVGGRSVECQVVHYAGDDFKAQHLARSRESTVWIDKSRNVIVKILDREQPLSNRAVNGRILSATESTRVYPVVELDQKESDNSFTFVAPEDARLVEAFSSPLRPGPRLDFIGKPAAELHLESADGTTTTLSSLRGKPAFLDFWATWCGPCKGLVPDLLKLYGETESKGLVWVGIDNDENPDAATKFVSQNHIPWPNYHDMDGSMGAAYQRNAIPLGILVDGHGNIAFYQSGYEISDLRAAIAKLGPEFKSVESSSAIVNRPQSQ
jgi:thiol-disulfide isomerase/thioredoxin